MLDVCTVGMWALGLPINIVIRWRWGLCMNVTAVEGEVSLRPDRAVGPVCGVNRVSSSVVTSTDGPELQYMPYRYHAASGVHSIEWSAWWPPRATRVGGVRYKSRSEVMLAHEALEPANIFSRGLWRAGQRREIDDHVERLTNGDVERPSFYLLKRLNGFAIASAP
jgi:hypothetical protein